MVRRQWCSTPQTLSNVEMVLRNDPPWSLSHVLAVDWESKLDVAIILGKCGVIPVLDYPCPRSRFFIAAFRFMSYQWQLPDTAVSP
jgi:hypothetical protein